MKRKKRSFSLQATIIIDKAIAIALLAIAAACMIFTDHMRNALPYILGLILLLLGVMLLYGGLKNHRREFTKGNSRAVSRGFVHIALGIVILVNRQDADSIIGAIWGMLGLMRNASELSEILYDIYHKHGKGLKQGWKLIVSLFGIAISILLMVDPAEHMRFHVFILGLELIDTARRVWEDADWLEKYWTEKA